MFVLPKFRISTLRPIVPAIAYLTAFRIKHPTGERLPSVQHPLTNVSLMSSSARHRFQEECEAAINRQINMELSASYVYLSMAYHFDRDDVALPGMHWYFKKASDEEREHAMKLMKYLNKRGGKIVLKDIKRPDVGEWSTAQDAMCIALDLEKTVNESLLDMHAMASDLKDANLCDFLETEFLQEQVDAIKEISDHVTNLKRVGEGLGTYMFDKQIKDSELH